MKVTNTSVTDKEIAEVLSQAGLTDKQIKAFFPNAAARTAVPKRCVYCAVQDVLSLILSTGNKHCSTGSTM